jgi:type IV pilus assembly protein PilE
MKIKYLTTNGFTIMELMISLAIVALVATIGIPSFNKYIEKAKRADVQTALLELANFMERQYSRNGSYLTSGGTPPTLPFTQSPRDSSSPDYQIRLSIITSQTYTLEAAPVATSGQINDVCGTLRLAHTGATLPTTNRCWAQ